VVTLYHPRGAPAVGAVFVGLVMIRLEPNGSVARIRELVFGVSLTFNPLEAVTLPVNPAGSAGLVGLTGGVYLGAGLAGVGLGAGEIGPALGVGAGVGSGLSLGSSFFLLSLAMRRPSPVTPTAPRTGIRGKGIIWVSFFLIV